MVGLCVVGRVVVGLMVVGFLVLGAGVDFQVGLRVGFRVGFGVVSSQVANAWESFTERGKKKTWA